MTKKHLLILALVVAVLCGAIAFLLKQESSSSENRVSENPASSLPMQASNVSSIEPERLPAVEKRNVRPSEVARSEAERTGRPYNFATRIATRPGYVLSPFSGKEIDVREIPPGTLVADPTFPQSEKKYFRVPE